jgi:hypothetical protein
MENASPAEDSFHRPSTNNNGVMENASPADHFLRHQSDVGTSLQIDPQLLGVQGSAMIDPQLLGEGSTQAQLQSQQGGVARLPVKSSGIKMTLRSLSKKPVSELAVLSDDSLSANPNNFHFECPLRSCPWVSEVASALATLDATKVLSTRYSAAITPCVVRRTGSSLLRAKLLLPAQLKGAVTME